jgi:peptidyl-tRNA hydrolase
MPERDPDPFVMYIIVRRSLKLSGGKVGAQCGHAVEYLMDEAANEHWPTKEEMDLHSKAMKEAFRVEKGASLMAVLSSSLTDEERSRLHEMDHEARARAERNAYYRAWKRDAQGERTGTKIVLGASDAEFTQVIEENGKHFPVIDLGYTQVAPNTMTCVGLWPMRKSWASATVKTLRPL